MLFLLYQHSDQLKLRRSERKKKYQVLRGMEKEKKKKKKKRKKKKKKRKKEKKKEQQKTNKQTVCYSIYRFLGVGWGGGGNSMFEGRGNTSVIAAVLCH